MTGLLLTALAAFALAFANGANDNAKGVATLVGGGTMGVQSALRFAAITTMVGSLAAIVLATGLIGKFGGKGIVSDEVVGTASFSLCVGIGAALTVLLATRIGLPISTTHAMVGSIIGIGLASGSLIWAGVLWSFVVPLLVSPLVAMLLALVVYLLLRWGRRSLGISSETCVCVDESYVPVTRQADGALVMASTGLRLTSEDAADCRTRLRGRFVGIEAQRGLDWSHIVSAGALSFARGLNDTPKIAALLVAAMAVGRRSPGELVQPGSLIAVGVGIVLGGLMASRRVARTMSQRITDMNDGQAFSANIVTAALVIFASRLGLPVSTTHVSCGSLFGIGIAGGGGRGRMISAILMAWVTTLPLAGLISWAAWRLF